MSGISESTAIVTGHEGFTLTSAGQNQTVIQTHPDQHIPVYDTSYRREGSSLYHSIQGGASSVKSTMNLNSSEQKRKRGRPRKYGPDGSMAMATASDPQSATVPVPQEQPFSPPLGGPPADTPTGVGGSSSPVAQKRRGRPPGSSNKKKRIETMGSTGIGFMPHVLDVQSGQDVASTLMTFSQHSPRTICILSATGVVSSVTLRHAASASGTATYEGNFYILLLSGCYFPSNVNGQISRTGGLSITLAGADGRVFGGCIAGVLTAASPVQVIVGSFIAEGKEDSKKEALVDQSSDPPKGNQGDGGVRSPSQGAFVEHSGVSASPPNLSLEAAAAASNNHHQPQGFSGMPWK